MSENKNGTAYFSISTVTPNQISKMQPLDAGIICAFKRHYQRLHVTELMRQLDQNPNKKPMISLKDAIYFIILAWKCVITETVQNCWRHAGVYPMQGEVQVRLVTKTVSVLKPVLLKLKYAY